MNSAELIDLHKGTVRLAGEIAEAIGMPLPELNLGGGFGASSIAGEEPIDVDAVANALTQTLCSANDMLATTRFAMELGRWLVAPAGVYLARVIDRKESGGRTFVVTDGGGHHLLDATGCLGEPGHSSRAVAVANRFDSAAEEQVTVTGCLCTPFDIFADGVSLPYTEPGDLIAIFGAGAYGPTASPQRWESRPPAREMLVSGVMRFDEIKAVGRCVEAERGAVAGFERCSHVIGRPLASADQCQATDHRAHLVVEEAARRGLDVNFLALASDLQPVEGLDRAVGLAMRRAESGEVVASDQHRRAFAHRLDIQRDRDVPHASAFHRRRRPPIHYAVQILAADT